MPQKFQVERRYVNTFLKMLFYTHALRRFDKPARSRRDDNLLILWADEAQRFVSASEEGMSDYNCIDVIREAQSTIVAAAQSITSFIPPQSAQSPNRPCCRRGRRTRKRRLPRKEARHQKVMGLLRRQDVAQLQRGRGTQTEASHPPRPAQTHRRRSPLRTRTPLQSPPTVRARWPCLRVEARVRVKRAFHGVPSARRASLFFPQCKNFLRNSSIFLISTRSV